MNLNKIMPTKKELFKDISDLDIYRCYMPNIEFKIGTPILSPLREEHNPSFGFFVGENNEIMFKDFKLGGGDCIRFVELKFGENFFEAISRIIKDFDLTDKYICKDVISEFVPKPRSTDRDDLISEGKTTVIRKTRRDWTLRDLAYWRQFAIEREILERYNVEPISHIFINDKIITCDKNTYCFVERKDGVETYKIYQPLNKTHKWINNHNESVWQGWQQLPARGERLIITKSLKDVMSIVSLSGIPAVSLQAESIKPKEHIVHELLHRFETVSIWYDNDFDSETNWGRQFGEDFATEYGLEQIEIPDEYQAKDISDFTKKYGETEAKELIEQLTNQIPF